MGFEKIIVKDTLEAWQPFYEQRLTENDAAEIQKNLVDFMKLLGRWNERKNSQLLDNN